MKIRHFRTKHLCQFQSHRYVFDSLFIYLFIYLFTYLFISLFIYFIIYLFIYSFIYGSKKTRIMAYFTRF